MVTPESTVPKLAGLSLAKASDRAGQSGFEVQVEKRFSGKPAGTVLSASPAAGSQLPDGSTLRLVVAKPFPRIPNVVGDKLKVARRTLVNRGFDIRVRKQVSSQPKATVISQSPDGGTGVRPGRTVILIIAKTAPQPSGGGGQPSNCTPGYSPCLPSGPSDYDCAGGSGDGPAYTSPGVTYHVSGSDPYGLDADNDGLGCE
jgi:PASTA domain